MYFKDLTLVPIQTKMIDLDLLLPAEEEWMDKYHKQVWAVQLVWQVWSLHSRERAGAHPGHCCSMMTCHVLWVAVLEEWMNKYHKQVRAIKSKE
jgi:hypothetical protein